jgi:hypothetical protein
VADAVVAPRQKSAKASGTAIVQAEELTMVVHTVVFAAMRVNKNFARTIS